MKHIFVLLLIVLAGCSTAQVNYIGESFDPTSEIQIYFDEEEIDTNYKVIGKGVGSGKYGLSNQIILDELVEEAKRKGADALLIEELDRAVFSNNLGHSVS